MGMQRHRVIERRKVSWLLAVLTFSLLYLVLFRIAELEEKIKSFDVKIKYQNEDLIRK